MVYRLKCIEFKLQNQFVLKSILYSIDIINNNDRVLQNYVVVL